MGMTYFKQPRLDSKLVQRNIIMIANIFSNLATKTTNPKQLDPIFEATPCTNIAKHTNPTKSHKMKKYTYKYIKWSEKIETHTFFLEI